MKIAVYCSSQGNLDSCYTATAVELGKWIGKNGHSLVYGGVDAGMMHMVAEQAHKAGARITGVLPTFFAHRADALNDENIPVADLNERKGTMIELADLFVVLPGGLGTIDEWISTLSQLVVDKDSRKKIIVVNIGGLYDRQLEQLKATAMSEFARSRDIQSCYVAVSSIDEMIKELEVYSN